MGRIAKPGLTSASCRPEFHRDAKGGFAAAIWALGSHGAENWTCPNLIKGGCLNNIVCASRCNREARTRLSSRRVAASTRDGGTIVKMMVIEDVMMMLRQLSHHDLLQDHKEWP
jgi:hypothetical protein